MADFVRYSNPHNHIRTPSRNTNSERGIMTTTAKPQKPAYSTTTPEPKVDYPTTKYVRKPFYVDAIQVTEDNLDLVAQWCKGSVQHLEDPNGVPTDHYVKVNVQRPLNEKQTKAYVGDWVLNASGSFKVYTQRAFDNSFQLDEPMTAAEFNQAVAETVPQVDPEAVATLVKAPAKKAAAKKAVAKSTDEAGG